MARLWPKCLAVIWTTPSTGCGTQSRRYTVYSILAHSDQPLQCRQDHRGRRFLTWCSWRLDEDARDRAADRRCASSPLGSCPEPSSLLRDEPMIPFRYGDYSAIRRPYLTAAYRADAAPWVVTASVYVEAEWDPTDADGEMDYVGMLRRTSGLPLGRGGAGVAGPARLPRPACPPCGARLGALRPSQAAVQRRPASRLAGRYDGCGVP